MLVKELIKELNKVDPNLRFVFDIQVLWSRIRI